MELPTLNPASGLNGEMSTTFRSRMCWRYFAEVAERRRLSAKTPTTVPSDSRAPSMALWSIPRAPPDTMEYPWAAAPAPSRFVKSRSRPVAFLDPTTARPPLFKSCLFPQPKRTGGERNASLCLSRYGYSGSERMRIQSPARCHFSRADASATPRSSNPSRRERVTVFSGQSRSRLRKSPARRDEGCKPRSLSQVVSLAHSLIERGLTGVPAVFPNDVVRRRAAEVWSVDCISASCTCCGECDRPDVTGP